VLYDKAQRITAPFDTGVSRGGAPFGVTYHTTGSGLPSGAMAQGKDPFQAGIDYYRASHGPTYLIGWKEGQIAAVARDEDVVTWHAGESESDKKAALMNGSWRSWVSPATVAHFERVYGAGKNPLSADGTTRNSVIPSSSANHATIGVEMIPVTPGGNTFWAPPMRFGLRFTKWQHDAARALAKDLARRYGWPSGWETTRILGHESLNPIERHDSGGGWDPGWLRADPYVDMDYIRGSGGAGIVILAAGVVGLAYLIKRSRR
jgi:hypothetical protein